MRVLALIPLLTALWGVAHAETCWTPAGEAASSAAWS